MWGGSEEISKYVKSKWLENLEKHSAPVEIPNGLERLHQERYTEVAINVVQNELDGVQCRENQSSEFINPMWLLSYFHATILQYVFPHTHTLAHIGNIVAVRVYCTRFQTGNKYEKLD